MSETMCQNCEVPSVCADCQRPEATKEQWSNNHGDGNGCACAECVSVCWGDTAYCMRVADARKNQPTELERYRVALKTISDLVPARGDQQGDCAFCGAIGAMDVIKLHEDDCPWAIARRAVERSR